MLNKGESLIETTVSIAIFLSLLIPTLNILNRVYIANREVDIMIFNKQNSYNILELIKQMKQDNLDKKICENIEFNKASDILKYLNLDYALNDEYGKYRLTIRKNDMYSGINSEYHGFYIKINKVEGIYVPRK